jgi:hypothetical protein
LRALLDDGSELVCTASLVGPNLVLTARHCVSYLSEGPFVCSVEGELTDNPEGGGRLGLHLPADSIEIYGGKPPRKRALAHGTQIISSLAPTICKNDLAFVVLDTALDLPLVPLRLGRPALAHETGVLVGFGLDETQTGIDYRTQPRRQKRDLQISAVGPDSLADGVTTVPPRALILRGPSGCIGDSGGPLLSQDTGAVLGVYSLQDGDSCSAPKVRHVMVHVPPFTTLIDEAFNAAGGTPVPEPEPAPERAAGGAGSEGGAGAVSGGESAMAGRGDAETNPGSGGNPSSGGAPSEPEPQSTASHSSSCSFQPPFVPPFRLLGGLALAGLLGGARRRARRRFAR